MDPLSDVLSLLKPRTYHCGGFDLGGDWSIQFGPHAGIKWYAVVSGQCWLALADETIRLKAGDGLLLPRGLPFRLCSDLALPGQDVAALLAAPPRGSILTFNGGGGCLIAGGFFTFAGPHAAILLGVLPAVVHLRKESEKAALRGYLGRMMEEMREPQPGGTLVVQQLATMMLVQALRLHLAEGLQGGVGWLFALADPQMGEAIRAIHEDPAQHWTLQGLAARVGMSRSGFAQRFKATVGETPMGYLTRWRMLLAGDRLSNSRDSVATIAQALGYESESAFGTAFKRVMQRSPRQYGRNPAGPGDPQA